MRWVVIIIISVAFIGAHITRAEAARFTHGLSTDPNYFPIAVWLQDVRNAPRYREIGVNLYVGLWEGPTEKQLAELEKAGMQVICEQNDVALKHLTSKVIVGWMHGDEPDNAQELPGGKGYGPPVATGKIVDDYASLRKADPTRPILLNLGQGVAWDGWHGRGVRTNHPEDYAEYVKGCDIVSFDIYPVVHDRKEVAGRLDYVPKGVERLVEWTKGEKPVWACIETTRIGNPKTKPTPQQARSEVWMAIIRGARGIIYFAHEFKPKFVEAGLLADKEMSDGVKAINAEVARLAPVINSAEVKDPATARASEKNVAIAVMTRQHDGATYVFAASLSNKRSTAHLKVPASQAHTLELIGETRPPPTISGAGEWDDDFDAYAVHLYRIAETR